MMGKQNGQLQMVILDIDSMIPEGHLGSVSKFVETIKTNVRYVISYVE